MKGSTIFAAEREIKSLPGWQAIDTPGIREDGSVSKRALKKEIEKADEVVAVLRGTHFSEELNAVLRSKRRTAVKSRRLKPQNLSNLRKRKGRNCLIKISWNGTASKTESPLWKKSINGLKRKSPPPAAILPKSRH